MERENVIKDIEKITSLQVVKSVDVGGGCIADTFYIELSDNQKYFVKCGLKKSLVFVKEGNGLKELAKSGINVPGVVHSCEDYILMSYIPKGPEKHRFFSDFGRSLANMHKYKSDSYGFYEDNYIGNNPQINARNDSWLEFYFINRLLFQFKLAEKNGFVDKLMHEYFIKLERCLPGIIEDSAEFPCLLHGDLWGGNYLCNRKGEAVLVDPAVYYGHREAELAMTKLFGGFSDEFYIAYNEEWPLVEDYKYRERVYLLYHLLNHLNLFGEGYYSQVMKAMKYYI